MLAFWAFLKQTDMVPVLLIQVLKYVSNVMCCNYCLLGNYLYAFADTRDYV